MRRRFMFLLLGVLLFSSPSPAKDIYDDVSRFTAENPDGSKYQFVKDYLKALTYLKTNEARDSRILSFANFFAPQEEKAVALRNELRRDNASWRVARNLVKKHLTLENGLILKAADTFIKLCDEQIDLNSDEEHLLENLYTAQSSGQIETFDKEAFWGERRRLAAQREESLHKLLEVSMLVSKILISSAPDRFGQLVNLGITMDQRKKLLNRLEEFRGKGYQGEVREGQTYLQAGIAVIRAALEDQSWGTLDG